MFTNVLTVTALALTLFSNQPQIQQQESWVLQSLQQGQAKIVAHRGGALEAWENSLTAFKQSAQIKVWGVQFAVRQTKDNQIIAFNDKHAHRVLQVSEEQQQWEISQFNYEELPAFRESIMNELGEEFKQPNPEQEKPPKFEEVLEVFKHTTQVLMIEDKLEDWGMKVQMFKAVKEAGMWNRVIWQSDFSREQIENAFELPTLYVQKDQETHQSYQNFFSGEWQRQPEENPIEGDVFKTTFAFETLKEAPQQFQQAVIFPAQLQQHEESEDVSIQQFYQYLDQKEAEVQIMNASLKQSGKPVFYWTVNQEADFQKAIELGASAMITDKPAEAQIYMMSQQWAAQKIQSAQWQWR